MAATVRETLLGGLRLPVIISPMFLGSTPAMVTEAAHAGVIGTCLAPNARTIEAFDAALRSIVRGLPHVRAPWAVSMIVHPTYARLDDELAKICEYRPPLVITALGSPKRIVPAIHAYGGLVFCDVATPEQARKAVQAGVDGLILLAAGAGGHTGLLSPFALVEEVREFWTGPLVLGGAIGSGRGIRAALTLGADAAYMGTRFLGCVESMVPDGYREMLVASGLGDIVLSSAPTGLPAHWLKASLDAAGFGHDRVMVREKPDFASLPDEVKAWKTIWSAGQSVGRTKGIESVREIVDKLELEFEQAEIPRDNA